jgi:hypothetical protein
MAEGHNSVLHRIEAIRAEVDDILRDQEYIGNRPREFHLWAGIAAQLYVASLYARQLPEVQHYAAPRPASEGG